MRWRPEVVLLAVVLGYGATLRSCDLTSAPLWTDEAESSINAFSILQHGLPLGVYLGQPVFENTLVAPWPEHPEYEFRDTSYSETGLALYHGWLPLYAIAASFKLHGIQPDTDDDNLTPVHDAQARAQRTRAARLPSAAFGLLFMLGVYLAAREIYGSDAGWAALAAACVSTTTILLARQARYYSLTLALAAWTALLFARLYTRGRRRDFAVAGVVFVLLFHTNSLAFLSAWGAFMLLAPMLIVKRKRSVAELLITAGIVVAGIVPWALATGFLGAAAVHPPARDLLEWSDVFDYARQRALFAAVALATLMWYVAVYLLADRLPRRVAAPFAQARWGMFFFFGWAFVAFTAFALLVPAASFFYTRLTLVILVPALLFGALLSAAASRALTPRRGTTPVAVVLYLLLLFAYQKTTFLWRPAPEGQPPEFEVIDHLARMDLEQGTRIYANAGASLVLRFYSGVPVRSALPVRREFFDTHERPIVIIEAPRAEPLSAFDVEEALAHSGVEISTSEARSVARWFNEEVVRRELAARGATVIGPEPRGLPLEDLEFELLTHARDRKSAAVVARAMEESGNPLFRGFRVTNHAEMWKVFFYRFVDPDARMGENLNYASRVRGAEAYVLSRGWTVLRSPARGPDGGGSAENRKPDGSPDRNGEDDAPGQAADQTEPTADAGA